MSFPAYFCATRFDTCSPFTNVYSISVIVLIAAEILVAAINIVVDMYWVD